MLKHRSLSDIWVDDEAVDFMQATNEEIEYLKRLRLTHSKQRGVQTEKLNYQVPSEIINDFLYHGSIDHARNMCLLDSLRIRHIINVSHIRLGQDIVNDYNVLWINIKDDTDVNIREYFDRTNEFLQACRSKNEKVLIHCRRGVSRSSSIVLAYLLKFIHDTLHQAYNHLVERRYIAVPNDAFFIQLIRYEKELHSNEIIDVRLNSSELIIPEVCSLTLE